MKILDLENEAFYAGEGLGDYETLVDYCYADVESMFSVARWCEKNRR